MTIAFETPTVDSVTVGSVPGLTNADRRFWRVSMRVTSRSHADLMLDDEPFVGGPVGDINELRLALLDLPIDGELTAVLDGYRVRLIRGLNCAR